MKKQVEATQTKHSAWWDTADDSYWQQASWWSNWSQEPENKMAREQWSSDQWQDGNQWGESGEADPWSNPTDTDVTDNDVITTKLEEVIAEVREERSWNQHGSEDQVESNWWERNYQGSWKSTSQSWADTKDDTAMKLVTAIGNEAWTPPNWNVKEQDEQSVEEQSNPGILYLGRRARPTNVPLSYHQQFN